MCEGQTFRGFVNERLAAAAGEMRALFERTTAEREEELRRSEDENKRKLRLLDRILSPRVVLVRVDTGPSLKREITESRIKEEPEEQSVTREEEQLPVCFPESSAVCVEREEPSPLRQRQTERGNISSEPHFRSETGRHTERSSDTDDDNEDWEPPFSRSDAQMETEADGDQHNQVQSRDSSTKVSAQNESAPETSATVNNRETSGADGGAERKKHQCHVCDKKFSTKQDLTRHIRVPTGEKPYKCSTCQKTFARERNLDAHRRTHTGERPYSCQICRKKFTQLSNLKTHRRTHTLEKPHGCSICNKTFSLKSTLDAHRRTHTGERPYSCQICRKKFTQLSNLKTHRRTHTQEKTHGCSIWNKTFSLKSTLDAHRRTHTQEKTYCCSICNKTFTQKTTLDAHRRTHTGERPYCCTVCEKTFTQRFGLKRHMKTHSVYSKFHVSFPFF